MTHHQYGDITEFGIEHDAAEGGQEAIIDTQNALLAAHVTTICVLGDGRPMFGLALGGKLNHSDDTLSVISLMSWEFAGYIVGEITQAAYRAGPEDLRIFEMGIERSLKGNENNG